MQVADVLSGAWDAIGPVNRPVMVLALEGLFDVAEAATGALDRLVSGRPSVRVAEIDPDPFFDFTQQRPQTQLDADGEREILWPSNGVDIVRFAGAAHDLVIIVGVEPHLRWGLFVDCLVEIAQRTDCELVVTLGAVADAVPHTRVPQVVASTTHEDLARRLGLSPPRYQGPTGVVGVLQERLDAAGIPGVSLRAPVPHYLIGAAQPQASAALLRHLEHVLAVPTDAARLDGEIARWRELHDAAVAEDPQAVAFVRMLEADYDRRTEASLPSGDDLAAAFEAFLAEQRPMNPDESKPTSEFEGDADERDNGHDDGDDERRDEMGS